jgi:UDP-N-acetylglucosamine pyrophosphorylase/galactokinase/mevalonate kinase-like predicted kinase
MSNQLIETIISDDDSLRNRSVTSLLDGKNLNELISDAAELEAFRRRSGNLYHKVRAALFLFYIYRFRLQQHPDVSRHGIIPLDGVRAACNRDFEKAIDIYLSDNSSNGALYSAVADAYYKLSFKYLLDQVKLSMSQCNENNQIYCINGLDDYPFRIQDVYLRRDSVSGSYPVGMDASPVRLDPSHSGWSDIFFLGMDFPEGARVVNLSVDLAVHGSGNPIKPPCECYSRFIEEPVIRLVSIDLGCSKDIDSIAELFNFGNDYLSLLKAGVVASGIVPPCFEGSGIDLRDLLIRLAGRSGGIEVVTKVNDIPKGSRLAVSTTLLATIITRLMRFSGQISNQEGTISESDRRIVASRAILGEWLGGSGGGWQDSGGLWPGIKVITGRLAEKEHPEYGVSRGCLLPEHNVLKRSELPDDIERKIVDSLVLVHGGISQDVGPVLEMVTEKYLLKYEKEWKARLKGIELFDRIVDALRAGNMKELGRLTTIDWEESIQNVIPWVNNAFTDELIKRARSEFGERYWGFLMLGGMSGGGMAFIVDPSVRDEFKYRIGVIMKGLKDRYERSLPFIIDPLVYDFKLNHSGITSVIMSGEDKFVPSSATLTGLSKSSSLDEMSEEKIKKKYGFDARSHDHMKNLLRSGDIGLAKNRLPSDTKIEDVPYEAVVHCESDVRRDDELFQTGVDAIMEGKTAVVTFAGGMGSRWSHGSTVVKSINPFIRIGGRYRTFIEIHIAKSRKTSSDFGCHIPHIFTTSYLTHDAIERYLKEFDYFGYSPDLFLSQGRSIAHRVYPTKRDLEFFWQQQFQQKMDDNVQKVMESTRAALIKWTESRGEAEDYSENIPILRFNPPGHWYEVPNILKNGVLSNILSSFPNVNYILCHNIDTMGVSVEPAVLGAHISMGNCITFEVTPRRMEDAGGGLAMVNGKMRLVEGMALPREEDEFRLSYYNTLTNWISIDGLLDYLGLDRQMIIDASDDNSCRGKIADAIHEIEKKMATYVTIKNVRHVWGSGQEDVYPVAQFEKLWGDMSALEDLKTGYVSVSRFRGQQLKEPALLDNWVNDGSLDYVKSRCLF